MSHSKTSVSFVCITRYLDLYLSFCQINFSECIYLTILCLQEGPLVHQTCKCYQVKYLQVINIFQSNGIKMQIGNRQPAANSATWLSFSVLQTCLLNNYFQGNKIAQVYRVTKIKFVLVLIVLVVLNFWDQVVYTSCTHINKEQKLN